MEVNGVRNPFPSEKCVQIYFVSVNGSLFPFSHSLFYRMSTPIYLHDELKKKPSSELYKVCDNWDQIIKFI